ncbi:OLC1v1014781C1 [Oldenlandia corymbosa var. corymbosa]|uniref:non-specific serine/threonine protein kinase n=1 Tax=Oldenlandia corymbosa var. corymbosa TaxID=529605 RepID=A0AAV1E1P7_OLDCO|nr:OLC1v1014781C1 [Oldenlandia corymbosa var. corymbosa]
MSSPPAEEIPAPESSGPHAVDSSPLKSTTLVALGVGIGIGAAVVLVIVCAYVVLRKGRKRGDHFDPENQWKQNTPLPGGNVGGQLNNHGPRLVSHNSRQFSDGSATPPPPSSCSSLSSERPLQQSSSEVTARTFSYVDLALATDSFTSDNLLGQGGFGYVFKGFMPDGKEVAIKQLKIGSGQGEREFQAEVETISHAHHKHLVSLVGYCTSGEQRLLVYEFVPNKTLEYHLHGVDCSPINWACRVKIALGSAKGLAFLHEECHPKIIHRDIKASNILIDNDFEAKVADFGLARFYPDTDTHVSTHVMGTFGYLAPEYALTGKLTSKSDVFSFGVMLLELITGRRPIDRSQHYLDDNIVDWARPLLTQALEDGNFEPLIDPRLQKDYDYIEMGRMVVCAAVCVRHLARRRPRMSQIVRALEGKISLEELNDGMRPGHSSRYDSVASSEYETAKYKEDLQKFREMALESNNSGLLNSSRVTNNNSGVQPSASSSEGLQT